MASFDWWPVGSVSTETYYPNSETTTHPDCTWTGNHSLVAVQRSVSHLSDTLRPACWVSLSSCISRSCLPQSDHIYQLTCSSWQMPRHKVSGQIPQFRQRFQWIMLSYHVGRAWLSLSSWWLGSNETSFVWLGLRSQVFSLCYESVDGRQSCCLSAEENNRQRKAASIGIKR